MPATAIIKLRRGTAAAWTSANPVLSLGEPGYETDTGKIKIGDGTTAWSSLAYITNTGVPTPIDGWVDDTAETWTYASGSGGGTATFTVSGDKTAKYTVGTRIKLTQTTVKYFVVSANPVFASGNTTVTITAGSDYTLANAAITNNFHSYVENPQGYPTWFTFATNATGFSSKTDDTGKFAVFGRIMHLSLRINGISNATTMTCDIPIPTPARSITYHTVVDNNTTANGRIDIAASTTSGAATFGKAITPSGGFTASGTKGTAGAGSSSTTITIDI